MENPYLIDVRDVVQRMKDKCYFSLGEAFEDVFSDCFTVDDETGEILVDEV